MEFTSAASSTHPPTLGPSGSYPHIFEEDQPNRYSASATVKTIYSPAGEANFSEGDESRITR